MLTVSKEFQFDAAHRLFNQKGKCKNIHGHTYKLIVEIAGQMENDPHSPSYGMVIDFAKLKTIVNNYIILKLDHNYLNTVLEEIPPTAEMLTKWISKTLLAHFPSLVKVILYDTPSSWATWYNKEYFK